MGEDIIRMSEKELTRVHIIRKVIDSSLKQKEAAEKLSLSERQIRRLKERVRIEGDKGLTHRLRGRASKRRIEDKQWQKILNLCRTVYRDFGPTFACEKLIERDKIKISDETLRKRLIVEGLWVKQRKARKHRKWRKRKACPGEMVQLDGSHHPWFEDRGDKCVLMGYIDDATGNKSGQFYKYEGTLPAFAGLKHYIKQDGIPLSVYVDRHSTYKGISKQTIEDELNDRFSLSQFERGCKELDIKVIHAHSPQAKGRIERSFKTDQDRLVKEMRLAGIKNIEEGNKFLKSYWPKHNKRFAVKPVKDVDMHRPLPADMNLDVKLCIKTIRTLRNDFTIVHHKQLYQIMNRSCPRKVLVEERINNKIVISGNGSYLKYKPITLKPVIEIKHKTHKTNKTTWRPTMEHPWKKLPSVRRISQSKQESLVIV